MKFWAVLILVLSFVTFAFAGYKTYLSLTHPIKYQNEIIELANEYDLDPAVVASVINIESSYNSDAKSNKNAIGLMQIKYSTAEYLCELYNLDTISEDELFEPKTNIKFGCAYLKYLSLKFENIYTVLASYNAGETRVRTWLKDKNFSSDEKILNFIPYKETRNYLKKFKENVKFYEKVYKFA